MKVQTDGKHICVCDSLHFKVCRCVSVTCMYKKATSVFIFQSFNPMDVNGLMVYHCTIVRNV